jgi:hypothetical protein
MKRSVVAAVMLATSSAFADIVLTNQVVTTTTRPVMTMVTNTMTVTNVKAVWSNFSVNYAPPAYTSCFYSVTYHLQDLKTKREIPGSRATVRLTEMQVADFAASKSIDFPQLGRGIGGLLNEYLKTLFTQPPPARTRTVEEQ